MFVMLSGCVKSVILMIAGKIYISGLSYQLTRTIHNSGVKLFGRTGLDRTNRKGIFDLYLILTPPLPHAKISNLEAILLQILPQNDVAKLITNEAVTAAAAGKVGLSM